MDKILEFAKNITESHTKSMKEGLRLGQLEGLRKARSLIDLEIEKLEEKNP